MVLFKSNCAAVVDVSVLLLPVIKPVHIFACVRSMSIVLAAEPLYVVPDEYFKVEPADRFDNVTFPDNGKPATVVVLGTNPIKFVANLLLLTKPVDEVVSAERVVPLNRMPYPLV